MHARLAFAFALALALTPALALGAGAQGVGELVPGASAQVVQDWSWYPFAARPPFVGPGADGDADEVIHAGSARFRAGVPPVLPDELTRPRALGGVFQSGFFLVHFARGVSRAQRAWLDALGLPSRRADGSALARWYVPNDTLALFVPDEATLLALESTDGVDWVGRYQPGYKLCATIGTAALTSSARRGRAFYRLHVDLMPGQGALAPTAQLLALGALVLEEVHVRGAGPFDVHFLVVDALPADVAAIASIEGVRYVQEAGDGRALHDLSAAGKIQARVLVDDDQSASPIVTASTFPLWVVHDLQGQGQLIGVVDTALDFNNAGVTSCAFGFPDTDIDNWGFALPNLARVLLTSPTGAAPNLKIPRVDLLGGATLQAEFTPDFFGFDREHGCAVSGAALGDFYGDDDTRFFEHDIDRALFGPGIDVSGLLGPGLAHEAQLYFTPVDDDGQFAWEQFGEFELRMSTTLANMAQAGTCATVHSTGIVEAMNTYTQVSAVHDLAGFDYPQMLQCMAAGNEGEGANRLTSQATVKNALTVGASDDVLAREDRASFSSVGPRFDGALKPDLLAPGTDLAMRANGGPSGLILPENSGATSDPCIYQRTQGTSFAAPVLAAAAALVHQYFEEGRYPGSVEETDPSAALMKAVLVNAGRRLTGANLGDGSYPSALQGFGEPVLVEVLDLGGARSLVVADVDRADGFGDRDDPPHTRYFAVESGAERLRATLVWTDEPGSTGSGKKLVNNLNLRLVQPDGGTYHGNVFDTTAGESVQGGSPDTLNNVENAIVSSPATGVWRAIVDPANGSYTEDQGYALVLTGAIAEAPDTSVYYFSFKTSATLPGVGSVDDEDVVRYDVASGTWSLYFDGSDVGLASVDVNALHVRPDGDLLLSFSKANFDVPGLVGGPSGETVTDSDLVLFAFTTSGANTSGTFSFFFDGSDVGLTTKGEDVDGVHELADGRLALSFLGSGEVDGIGAFDDEDVLLFTPSSTGADTAGSFALFFDGSDAQFADEGGEDLDALALDLDGALLFSTVGTWSAKGGGGADEDVGWFSGSFGADTDGVTSRALDLSLLGVDATEDVDGMSFTP